MTKEVFYDTNGNGQFLCDREIYSAFAKISQKPGYSEDEVIQMLIGGDFSTVATQVAEVTGKPFDEVYEKWFAYQSPETPDIILDRWGREYRMSAMNGTSYYPIQKGSRRLREEARVVIAKQVIKDMAQAYDEERGTGWNLYKMAIRKSADWFKEEPETPEPQPEEEEAPEQKPEPQMQTEIIRERVIEREKVGVLEGMLQQIVCETVSKVTVNDMVPRIKEKIIDEFGFEPQVHKVVLPDGKEQQFQGLTHKVFDEVLFFIANDIPVYLFGPAGSGKNVLTEQVAKALGLDFYFMNSVTDEYKVTGFIDAGGNYHETEFYKAFKNGGVFFLDEMDASAPEVLVNLNAAIANRYFAFPNGRVQAHPNFRVVAAGNTLGTGADAMYTGRMQLDAATLNRFETVPVDYDERIDLMNADNDTELVEFIHGYRKAIKRCGLASVASYRNIKMIKAAEKAMDLEKALCYSLTKEMNKDDINTIVGSGELPYGNKYTKALGNVKSLVG